MIGGMAGSFGARNIRIVRKTVDETLVGPNTTLQADDHLSHILPANTVWIFQMGIFYRADSAADFKVGVGIPSGASIRFGKHTIETNSTDRVGEVDAFSGTFTSSYAAAGDTNADATALYTGSIEIGGTAGAVQFQWAQNNSHSSNVIVRKGSYFLLIPVE